MCSHRPENNFAKIYRKSDICREYEPVPGDFSIKTTTMNILSNFVDMNGKSGLEVGCGCGYNAALLSSSCDKLVATDLPFYDSNTHSLGITVARQLLSKLGVSNVQLVSCSGESLPFPDGTFDFVYSSSVLEHIDDKKRALKEMMRVVKPGGSVIFIIPTYIQSLCAFVHLYLYIGKRMLKVICTKLLRKKESGNKGLLPTLNDAGRSNAEIMGSFWKNHPSFPLPQPHGEYKNIAVEFASQLPWKWTGLARSCGARSVKTFATFFLPFNILEVFSTKMIANAYKSTEKIHKLLAGSFMQYFSYSWCVVAKK